jgi:predicted flap endonuclease-1-like 5' DNA nuclease
MEDDSDAGTAETSDPVETVRGIGPAYGTRLGDVGVETVADLAAADPGDLARTISVAESRVDRWVARARGRKDE